MNGVPSRSAQRAPNHSSPPGGKRGRDGDAQGQGDRKGGKKRQIQPPVSLTQLSGGLAHGGTAQSSLLLCLHALTHCTDQLKQSAAEPSHEDFQLLSDIASAAGRLQRLARQRLQQIQAAPADAEQQPPSRLVLNQHDASQKGRPDFQQAVVQAQVQQQQQEGFLHHPQTRSPANRSCSKQQQQQAPEQRLIQVKVEPSATVKAIKSPSQQQQAKRPKQAEVKRSSVQQGTTAAWQVDKQPFVMAPTQVALTSATRGKTASHGKASRAAAALEAALTAAAAEACVGQHEVANNSAQQKAGAAQPAVQLPALKPVSQLPRDRLKSLAASVNSQSTAAVAAAKAAAVSAKPPVTLVGQQKGVVSGVPAVVAGAKSSRSIPGGPRSTAANNTQHLSSDTAGSGAATSSCTSTSSSDSSSSGSSDDKSSNSHDNDSSSNADSDTEMPLTQLQDKQTPKEQNRALQKQQSDVAVAHLSQAAPSPTPAAGDEGPQQCLICRKVFPANNLISSKLFCSCKGCLAAAVSRGSSRGYRVAQCPKRGCNAMVIRLGKSGWHTGDSGQAHHVDIDAKTGLFRIGYSRKSSSKKRGSRAGARKGEKGSRKHSAKT